MIAEKIPAGEIKKIVILNTIPDTIGDSLFLTPVFRILKKNFPEKHLAITTTPKSAELFRNNPYLDELILFPEMEKIGGNVSKLRKAAIYFRLMFKIAKELGQKNFDLAIIPQPNFFLAQLLPFLAGIKYSIGYKYPGSVFSFLLTKAVKFFDPGSYPDRHYLESNLDLIKPLNPKFNQGDKRMLRVVTRQELNDAKKLLKKYKIKGKFICFQAGAKWKRKQWPQYGFRELAEILAQKSYKILLFGSSNEWQLNEEVKGSNKNAINLSGKVSLSEIAAILKLSKLLVGNDSGLIHLASSVGTRTVAIYGTTSLKHSRTIGYAKGVQVFNKKALPSKLYMNESDECDERMAAIQVNDVLNAAIRQLRS